MHKKAYKYFQWKDNVVLLRPRGFWKTTTIKINTIRNICYKQEDWILFVMPKSLWQKTVGDIAQEFQENDKIREIFWDLVPNKTKKQQKNKWRMDYLMFLNDVDLQTVTKGQSIRWSRKTLIHIDDPEEDKDVINPLTTQAFKNRVAGTIEPILRYWKCIVTWTVLSDDCFVYTLYQQAKSYKKIKYEACKNPVFEIIDNRKHLVKGKALWEERRPIKLLDTKLQNMIDINPMFWYDIFMREYFNLSFVSNLKPVFDLEVLRKLQTSEPIEKSEKFPWLWIYKDPCECWWWIDLSMGWPAWDFTTIVARNFNYNLIFTYQARVLWYNLIDVIDFLDDKGYYWTKVFERNVWTAQAIFDMVQDRPRYGDIYRQKNEGQVVEKETLNLWRHTNQQSKQKMIAWMQSILVGYTDEFNELHKIKEVDEREARELPQYYIDEKNRMNALPPHHDDLIIADALCLQGLKEWLWLVLDF